MWQQSLFTCKDGSAVSSEHHRAHVLAGGERILQVFENRLTQNIKQLDFSKMLESGNVDKVISEADGYQPHLVAPEMGYRRLLQECLVLFKVPALPPRIPTSNVITQAARLGALGAPGAWHVRQRASKRLSIRSPS